MLPSVELNCILPAARDGARARLRHLGGRRSRCARRRVRRPRAHRRRSSREHGGVAYLAHPYWTGATPGTLELPENVAGIEVWNAGCELEVGRGLSSVHWDELLETGRRCFGLVTDDSHHPGFDSGHGWTWLRVPERTREAVLAALAAGSFYGSSGPVLHDVAVDGRRGRGALQPGPLGDARLGSHRGRGRECGPARLPLRGRGARGRRRRRITHARLRGPSARDFARIEVDRRERATARGRTRCETTSRDWRERRRFDLLVIGGGIVGAGIANEAAQAGLAVALVDRGDFGGATSSASSKLIHGGLRYLRLGDVKLVREAHRERRALLEDRRAAPRPEAAVPVPALPRRSVPAERRSGSGSRSTRRSPATRLGGLLPPARALQSVPDLRLEGLRGCGVYIDSFTHDGRLCLANVRATAAAGGVVANYAEVVALRQVGGSRARRRGARSPVGRDALRRGARGRERDGPVDRRRSRPRGSGRAAARPPVEGRAPAAGARPALVGGADDSARSPCASRSRIRGRGCCCSGRPTRSTRATRRRSPSSRQTSRASSTRRRSGSSASVLDPGRVRASFAGLRVLPGLSGETLTARRETPIRRRPRRDADGGRREAHDLPPDRAARARAAATGARRDAVRPGAAAAAGRARARGRGHAHRTPLS